MKAMPNEPSMEEILSSIKRIIAEDDAPAPRRKSSAKTPKQAVSQPRPTPEAEVLELTDAVDAAEPEAPAAKAPLANPPESAATDPVAEEDIVSAAVASASRNALASLARLKVRAEDDAPENSLEGLVRDMLRPMLKEWLDANLPRIVEAMVAKEIARISGDRP